MNYDEKELRTHLCNWLEGEIIPDDAADAVRKRLAPLFGPAALPAGTPSFLGSCLFFLAINLLFRAEIELDKERR